MKERIANLIIDQVSKIRKGGPFVLFRKCFLLLIMPFLLLIVLLARLLRPFILIRFGKLINSRIGHFAIDTELYLSERDAGILGQRSLDFFYINDSICNRQLMKMWGRTLWISPFTAALGLANRALPGGDRHTVSWRINQDRDIYGTLESTKVHISFTSAEERVGQELLKKIGIINGSPFVCLLSRSPAYLNTMFPKGNWYYHGHRDSNISNFIPAAEELTGKGYFVVRIGAVVNEKLKTDNPMVVDYATRHRTDFLDIFLGAKCNFYLGDSCGFNAIPMIFRRPLAIVNMIPLEYAPTWSSKYLFIPKKLRLRKERRLLTFSEILGSEIGRFLYSQQYDQLGIEVIENTPQEITDLAVEMDQRLRGVWQADPDDEGLQKRFWALFNPSELNKVFLSRIGAQFLRQNRELLE